MGNDNSNNRMDVKIRKVKQPEYDTLQMVMRIVIMLQLKVKTQALSTNMKSTHTSLIIIIVINGSCTNSCMVARLKKTGGSERPLLANTSS